MIQKSFVLIACAALVACSSRSVMSDDIGRAGEARSESQGETAQGTLDRRLVAEAEPFRFADNQGDGENALRDFDYSWPRQVSAIPQLAAVFEQDLQTQLTDQKRRWEETKEYCPEDFISCRRDTFSLTWKVIADTPRFLSLSSSFSTYTGGAHGNYGRTSTVWARAGKAQLEPLQLFQSVAALEAALGKPACAALNTERAKRRGAPVLPDPGDWSSACVAMEDTVLFLGSSTGKSFDRIGVYYGPYVAGAYAEGSFEFTLPVTQSVIDAVKPDYKAAFALAPEAGA